MKKKKLLTSVIALGTAAALTLGGTFAWQSINQSAINEASDINNPGGRLHDDFNGTNKDVYVENFAEEDIFARVRLEEFFEIVLNAGTKGEKVVSMIGSKEAVIDEDGNQKKTEKGNPVWKYAYEIFKDYDGIEDGVVPAANVKGETVDDATTSWWNWTTGGSKVYMPTFNKNKDSLKADISGEYKFDTGLITDQDIEGGQYTEMAEWEENDEKTAYSVYDIDSNKLDEIAQADLAALIESGTVADDYTKNVKTVEETHKAKETADAALISMYEWLGLAEDEQVGNYWVYDDDGWVYWASPIKPDTATGLLLDGIALSQVMDDSWYYAINVVAQFCTANDMGDPEKETGFYADGEAVSENAEKLLEKIGVTVPADNATGDNETDNEIIIHKDDTAATVSYTVPVYNPVSIGTEGFSGDVTYTISNDAKWSNVIDIPDSGKALFVSQYEVGDPFTVTATDDDGNTGTVTINYSSTSPRRGVIGYNMMAENGVMSNYGDGELFKGEEQKRYISAGEQRGASMSIERGYTGTLSWKFLNAADDSDASTDEIWFVDGSSEKKSTVTTTFADGYEVIFEVASTVSDGTKYKLIMSSETPFGYQSGSGLDSFDDTVKEIDYWYCIGEDPNSPNVPGGGTDDSDTESTTHTLASYSYVRSKNIAAYNAATVEAEIYYDGHKVVENCGNLSAKVYAKGDTDTLLATLPGSAFYQGDHSELYFDLDKYVPFEEGSTSYDLYFSYTSATDGTTVTTETPDTFTFVKEVALLKEGSGKKSWVDDNSLPHMYLEVDGVSDPWAGMTTSREVMDAIKVNHCTQGDLYFGSAEGSKDNYDYYRSSDANHMVYVYFEDGYVKDVIYMYGYGDSATLTLTLNGKTYSCNFEKIAND